MFQAAEGPTLDSLAPAAEEAVEDEEVEEEEEAEEREVRGAPLAPTFGRCGAVYLPHELVPLRSVRGV